MALLTDPAQEIGPVKISLVKYQYILYVIMYVGCIAWLCFLADDNFSADTYFSENALLPGLVQGEYMEEKEATLTYTAFIEEKKNRTFDAHQFMQRRFKQLHMESYIQKFTINIPFMDGRKIHGRNVYGILRAPRSASTEALVLSIPYRPDVGVESSTLHGLAIMFSMAKFFRRQKYWAKDIIFLVTEYEHLGVQAWLDAYHGTTCGTKGVIVSDNLEGRSGSIQAALNLEIHSFIVNHIDVKISGLNGQLPNLDLVNLVHRICAKEGMRHTFYNKDPMIMPKTKYWNSKLKTMISMIVTQAVGVPDGNHGLFHRFGIEAVTLKAYPPKNKNGNPTSIYYMGRVLEGLFRSLNNLLERFHQSYFFYLLPSNIRYVSIGYYMPCLGMLVAALFLRSFTLWISTKMDLLKMTNSNGMLQNSGANLNLLTTNVIMLSAHAFGISIMSFERLFIASSSSTLLKDYMLNFHVLILISSTAVPVILMKFCTLLEKWPLLSIFSLIELGSFLLCISMHNFSFGYILSLLYVPPCILINSSRFSRDLKKAVWLLVHPIILLHAVVFVGYLIINPQYSLMEIAIMSHSTVTEKLLASASDVLIYGNWTYTAIATVLLPNWIMFWCLLNVSKPADVKVSDITTTVTDEKKLS